MVDIHKIEADFRDACELIQSSFSQTPGVNKLSSFQSPTQRRLSISNLNPRPQRGTEDANEKQIAEKWHIVTLQEASDDVEHKMLHERFHVTYFAGCAILFNKDTFYLTSALNRSTFVTRGCVPALAVARRTVWKLCGCGDAQQELLRSQKLVARGGVHHVGKCTAELRLSTFA